MDASKKSSKFIGVWWDNSRLLFESSIKINGKKTFIGRFKNEIDAAMAYDEFIIKSNVNRKLNFYNHEPASEIPNTRLVRLTNNEFALVDEDDFEKVNEHQWFVIFDKRNKYAGRNHWIEGRRRTQTLHNFVMGGTKDKIDHKNGNGLHNYKSNLRKCCNHQNSMNQKARNGCSSTYKGVCWNKRIQKFQCKIGYNYKTIHLGYFLDEIEAAKAYDDAAKKYFGEFANTNFKN